MAEGVKEDEEVGVRAEVGEEARKGTQACAGAKHFPTAEAGRNLGSMKGQMGI